MLLIMAQCVGACGELKTIDDKFSRHNGRYSGDFPAIEDVVITTCVIFPLIRHSDNAEALLAGS